MVNLLKVIYFLAFANKRLHWDSDRLKRYQDKRFRAVVKFANDTVPFYHRKFKETGVDVENIRKIEDLHKLPVIKKEEFKKQDPKQIVSSNYELSKLKRVSTSGSTGTPFIVYINSTEDAWRKAIYMRANIACGQKAKDRWVVLTSPTHFKDTTGIQRKIGVYAQNCISLFEPTNQRLKQISDARPDVLDGYSSSITMLAKEVKRRDLKTIKPHLLFGNAEYIDIESRKFVQEVFEAPYCDQFGCAEMDRTAWQCLEREGYHMDVDSVITEFLDKNGQMVNPGEEGEVTYTSLFNFSMPFIRYAIGDIGVPSDDKCSCGQSLPLMKMIAGRKDSFLTLPGNRVLSPMVFNFAVNRFKYYDNIDQYRIHQKRIDYFDVYLKMNRFPKEQNGLSMEFADHLKNFLNITQNEVKFNISFVDDIPLSKNGKLMSVWSDIKM
jgi:phenylacetate-CoA ligase